MLSIYNYDDVVDFLSSYLNKAKSHNPDFSLKSFSENIGLNSTAPLVDILKRKKKIKNKLIPKIVECLELDNSEVVYFTALVSKSQNDDQNKELMYDLLISDLSPNEKQSHSSFRTSSLDIFSHWIYMAILSLSELPGFDLTVSNIQKKLKEDIDEVYIDNALNSLVTYGLLEFGIDGKIKKKFLRNSTKSDIRHNNVHLYYKQVCDLAKNAISVPLSKREFNTFSFPISEDDIPLAKEIIRKCRNSLAKLSENENCNEVFQANLMLFPLTGGDEVKQVE